MYEVQGKYTTALITTNDIESTCVGQITQLINHPSFSNKVAIMPDCHAGKGCVIGFTMPLTNSVCPNLIGVDIGCGMNGIKYKKLNINREEIDKKIRAVIPFGQSIRNGNNQYDLSKNQIKLMQNELDKMWVSLREKFGNNVPSPPNIDIEWFKELCVKVGMNYERAQKSIGTLGGGRIDCLQTERQ